VTILFVVSIGIAAMLGGEFMPKSDQAMLYAVMESPSGTPIEQTRMYAYKLEDIIRETIGKEEFESLSIFYGEREGLGAFGVTSSTIELMVKLTPREKRGVSQFELQDRLRKRLDQMPGITYVFQEGGTFTNEREVEVKVTGFDIAGATAIANTIKAKMEQVEGLVDVSLNVKETTAELQVHLNKELMNHYGLSSMQVAANISTAVQGRVASQYHEKGDEYDIFVQFAKEYRDKKESLEQIMNLSLNQTLGRTMITSGTVFLTLIALYLFGGEVINDFAFIMLIGTIEGVYSTIALSCPVVLFWQKAFKTKKGFRR